MTFDLVILPLAPGVLFLLGVLLVGTRRHFLRRKHNAALSSAYSRTCRHLHSRGGGVDDPAGALRMAGMVSFIKNTPQFCRELAGRGIILRREFVLYGAGSRPVKCVTIRKL